MRTLLLLLLLVVAGSSPAFAQKAFPQAAPATPPPAAASAQGKLTIAVMPLRADALQLNEVKRLNFLVRQRAATRGGFELQSEDATTELLEASQSLGINCDVNAVDCGTQIGRIADVDRVLLGRAVGALAGGPGVAPAVGIELRLIDVKQGVELRRVSALVPTEVSLQVEAVNALADLLHGDGPLVALDVVAEPAGAEVRVDGVARGEAPLAAAIDALVPGEHHVLISKKGFLPFEGRVRVDRGEAARLEVRLEFDPEGVRTETSGVAVAVPFVVAGVGAALAIGGGVLTVVGVGPWFRYEAAVAAIDGAKTDDAGYSATVTEQWRQADAAATDWETWGQGTTAAGIVLSGIGAAAAIAGVAAGIYLLTVSADEGAEAAVTE